MNLRPCAALTEAEARRKRAAREAAQPMIRQVAACLAVALVLFATWDHWARSITADPPVMSPGPGTGKPVGFIADAANPPANDSPRLVSWSVFGPAGISPLAEAPERRSPHWPHP